MDNRILNPKWATKNKSRVAWPNRNIIRIKYTWCHCKTVSIFIQQHWQFNFSQSSDMTILSAYNIRLPCWAKHQAKYSEFSIFDVVMQENLIKPMKCNCPETDNISCRHSIAKKTRLMWFVRSIGVVNKCKLYNTSKSWRNNFKHASNPSSMKAKKCRCVNSGSNTNWVNNLSIPLMEKCLYEGTNRNQINLS